MKQLASITALILSACAYAEHMVVSSLPDPLRPRAEAETNVTFSAGAAGDNLWRLSVELVYWGVDFVSCSNMFSTVAQRIAADTNGWVRIEKGTVYEERNCLDGYANHN